MLILKAAIPRCFVKIKRALRKMNVELFVNKYEVQRSLVLLKKNIMLLLKNLGSFVFNSINGNVAKNITSCFYSNHIRNV